MSELEDALLGLAGLVAAAVAAWLVASIIGWCLTLRQGPMQSPVWQRLAAPGTRRLAELLLGVSLFGLASCSTPATTPTLTLLDSPATASSSTAPPTTAPPTTAPPTTAAPPPTELPPIEPSPESVVAVSATYVVQPGDNLWTIACALLEQRNGASPTSTETADFWRQLVAANRSRITSGDVDLIHPGEELHVE